MTDKDDVIRLDPEVYWRIFDRCGCHAPGCVIGVNSTHEFDVVGRHEYVECKKCGASWLAGLQ